MHSCHVFEAFAGTQKALPRMATKLRLDSLVCLNKSLGHGALSQSQQTFAPTAPSTKLLGLGAPPFLCQASLLSYTARTVGCWQLNLKQSRTNAVIGVCLIPQLPRFSSLGLVIHTYGLWRLQLLEKVIFGTITFNRMWNSFWTFWSIQPHHLPSTLVVSRAHHINILSMCHHNQTIFCILLATLQGETLFKRAGVTWPYTSCVAAPWVYVDMLPRYVLCELCVYIPTWFHMSIHIALAQSNACCIDACSMYACMCECMNGWLWMTMEYYGCMHAWKCIHLYTCCRMLLSVLVYTDAVDVVQKRQPHHDFLQHGYNLGRVQNLPTTGSISICYKMILWFYIALLVGIRSGPSTKSMDTSWHIVLF